MTESHVFQIVNWYTTDIEVEDSDDDVEDEEEGMQNQPREKYVMKLFGVDEQGSSISATVTDFTPHFYVKIHKQWSNFDIQKLSTALRMKMGRSGNGKLEIKCMKKKDFWGFSNNSNFCFLRLCFDTHKAMKIAARVISNGNFIVNGINQRKFQPYESNIDPFLRFAHIQNIQPAGWVEIPKNKCTPNDILPSKCATDVRVNWKFVHHIEKEAIAPLLVASFDLECMSSDGDFPVPIKNYQKIATDLYNIYHSMRGKQADEYDIKRALSEYMLEQFDKKLVFPKYEDEVKSLRNKLDRYLDHIVTITRGDKGTMERSFKDVFQSNFNKVSEAPEHCLAFFNRIKAGDITTTALRKSVSTWMEKCFESNERILEKQCDPEESIEILIKILFCDKDGIITTLTRFLNEVMPELKGDEIIQIGTTFHRYGEQECHRKVIFSLGTCDHIDGIEVQEFDNEEDMIVAWTELINDSDPDIITGYNIFGFDFNYIYHRAVELGCDREFCRIGRIIGQVSKYKESKLSSSALGDNLMKFVDIEGRTLIDLMKVVQRDHKLDSYKLDNVANHFMKMNKNDVTPQDIFRLFKGSSADRAIVADYCVQDCALCNKLMMKLEIVANNVGMANVCSVPLSWIFMRGQGVKIFSLVAKECKNQGFLIPVVAKPAKKKLEEVTEDELEKDEGGYEGAIVLEPKTGIYIDTPISIFDYASLYPSSMISENISHDSIVLDEKYDNLPGVKYLDVTYDLYEKVGDEKNKIGEQVCRYVQPENGEKGVIPNILMHLLKQRKLTRKKIGLQKVVMKDGVEYTGFYQKGNGVVFGLSGEKHEFSEDDVENVSDVYNNFQKAVLDGLQLAYKVTANSLYGQVGASTSPLYLKYLAASTTATGRKMIMLAKDFMEQEYKADIVYGDTDSIFCTFPTEVSGLFGKEAIQKTLDISLEASDKIKPLLKKPHDLEYEKIFFPMILFSKKRYCANKYEHDVNKFKQISMGIVLKRRDNANIVKKIYGGIIDIILNKHDIKESIRFLSKSLQDLIAGEYPLEDFIITKTLKGHYKDPSKIAHKVLAERIKERSPGNAPQANDRIPFAYIDVKDQKVLQGERIEHPDYIKEKNLKLDYAFYITNQLQNPVLQLYALILEQLDGYRKPADHWTEMKTKLEKEGKSQKFVREKIADLREEEARKLLLEETLVKIKLGRTGQKQITDFFKLH